MINLLIQNSPRIELHVLIHDKLTSWKKHFSLHMYLSYNTANWKYIHAYAIIQLYIFLLLGINFLFFNQPLWRKVASACIIKLTKICLHRYACSIPTFDVEWNITKEDRYKWHIPVMSVRYICVCLFVSNLSWSMPIGVERRIPT